MRLLRRAPVLVAFAVVAAGWFAGCSSSSDSSDGGTTSSGPVLSGSPDTGTYTFDGDAGAEASVLLAPCDPSNPTSCSTGFTCFSEHTSASWWVDLYGTCTFDCNSQTYALCDSLDGICGCPVAQGQTTSNCSLDGGTAMVCVPAVKPGSTPGAGEGDGGCGTPGCSGGPAVEAGAQPVDAGNG